MSNKKKTEITLDVYNQNKHKKHFFYVSDIKKACKKYNLEVRGKKDILKDRLFSFFESLNKYNKNIDSIIFLQRQVKKKQLSNKIKLQGIGIMDKSKCVNQEDFYTLDSIKDIDDKYFFSFESNNCVYFFDIRSFDKLLKNKSKNPYTREEIPKHAIRSFNLRKKYIINNNINIEEFEQPKLTKKQMFNNKVVTIFQKIDLLNVVAGGVDTTWFTNLNLIQLKLLYKILEDIWNYRAELTNEKKQTIVPNRIMFEKSVKYVYSLYSKSTIQHIILDEIDALISSAVNNNDKITGSYFVLTALVEVSQECSQSLPWLIQH